MILPNAFPDITWVNGMPVMPIWPEATVFFILPLFFILEIVFVKIGLKLAKAQTRKSFKWVILSVLIQVGLFAFVALPFVFFAFMGMMNDMSIMGPLLGLLMFFAMFLDICAINIIHKIGPKRSVGVFIFLLIPIFIMVGVIGAGISMSYTSTTGMVTG